MEVPGKIGWPVIGDTTMEFYRDPVQFLEKNMQMTKSKVFAVRFLNRPTVFVCTHKGVTDSLNDASECFDLGYAAFMKNLFGDNILFETTVDSIQLRKSLRTLFTKQSIGSYLKILNKILNKRLPSFKTKEPFNIYNGFKGIFEELTICMTLGIDPETQKETYEKVVRFVNTHWSGIAAVPIGIPIPGATNSYSNAMKAKTDILEFVGNYKSSAREGIIHNINKLTDVDDSAKNYHLLLFTSSIISKAFASICSSVVIELGLASREDLQRKARESCKVFKEVLLETIRLYPPIFGGRRIARKKCVVGGYTIPKDYGLVFMTYPAQRDEKVFKDPNCFKPERWKNDPNIDYLFTFGLGPRSCIGKELSIQLIETTLAELLSRYSWKVPHQNFDQKFIPVSRPKVKSVGLFRPISVTPQETETPMTAMTPGNLSKAQTTCPSDTCTTTLETSSPFQLCTECGEVSTESND